MVGDKVDKSDCMWISLKPFLNIHKFGKWSILIRTIQKTLETNEIPRAKWQGAVQRVNLGFRMGITCPWKDRWYRSHGSSFHILELCLTIPRWFDVDEDPYLSCTQGSPTLQLLLGCWSASIRTATIEQKHAFSLPLAKGCEMAARHWHDVWAIDCTLGLYWFVLNFEPCRMILDWTWDNFVGRKRSFSLPGLSRAWHMVFFTWSRFVEFLKVVSYYKKKDWTDWTCSWPLSGLYPFPLHHAKRNKLMINIMVIVVMRTSCCSYCDDDSGWLFMVHQDS